jgi:hypothetical protein
MKRRPLDMAAVRRREIERHASHVGAAETDDFWRWPVAWCWHNSQSKDPVYAVMGAVARMGGTYTITQAENILEQAKAMHQRRKARPLGKFLGVTYEHRRICGIKTFGPSTPPAIRREQNRMTQESRRRARGAQSRDQYESNSLSRRMPWKVEGISRRSWYRKRKHGGTSPSAIIPTPKVGTSPSAIIFLFNADTPVPAETPQAAVRANAQPCTYGKHFTKRWIAARQACCLRNKRWRMTDLRRGRVATAHQMRPRLGFSQPCG